MAWPNDPIMPPPDTRTAWQVLAEIVHKAHLANAPNIDLIIYLALKCAANDHGGNVVNHSAKVLSALNAADLGWWGVVANELDHDV